MLRGNLKFRSSNLDRNCPHFEEIFPFVTYRYNPVRFARVSYAYVQRFYRNFEIFPFITIAINSEYRHTCNLVRFAGMSYACIYGDLDRELIYTCKETC